jgi:sRNA-binding protein
MMADFSLTATALPMIATLSAQEEAIPTQAQAPACIDATDTPTAVQVFEAVQAAEPDAPTAESTPQAPSRPDGRPASKPRRKARGERPDAGAAPQRPPQQAPRATPPVLDQLADLYPGLFGEVFLPLKRGIYQDLLAAHPDVLDREALKAGLAIHTRSTRYLQSVAAGQKRHDLQGEAVEDMAPEHVHHALLEVFRRRQGRVAEDLRPKLRHRIGQAFEASGLSREAYTERVHSRDEAANAMLEEVLSEAAARAAKDEALLRAFEASGQALDAFADMYGMDPREAARTLDRARHRRTATAA